MCAPYIFKLNTLIHELICVKNNFQPAFIKNDNGAAAKRKKSTRTEPTTPSMKKG